jgi:hypothetical protein
LIIASWGECIDHRKLGGVESAPSQGEHKASPLLCYGFASWGECIDEMMKASFALIMR